MANCRQVGQTIADYQFTSDGDTVMGCLLVGKDSLGRLDSVLVLRRRAPIRVDPIADNLDQRQRGFPERMLPEGLTSHSIPLHIEASDTYSIVKCLIPEGQTTYWLCSRLRHCHLYRIATELGTIKSSYGWLQLCSGNRQQSYDFRQGYFREGFYDYLPTFPCQWKVPTDSVSVPPAVAHV